jgi:hypothetical protein
VRSGYWIDAVDLTYDAPGAPEPPAPIRCGGGGGSEGRVLTLDRGEYIVRVMGKWTITTPGIEMPQSPAISYLYVQTNKGKIREFGNSERKGYFFDYIAVEGTGIAGFVINSGAYVNAIGVILRKQPREASRLLTR